MIAAFERDLVQKRVVSGEHCCRPRDEIDLSPAVAVPRQVRGLKGMARILKAPRATLRRRWNRRGNGRRRRGP